VWQRTVLSQQLCWFLVSPVGGNWQEKKLLSCGVRDWNFKFKS
jgi:hypothetical protein